MFGSVRRSPLRGLALVALGFLLASVVGGGSAAATGAGIGLLVLPFLVLKMIFMFMMFGAFFRFAGMGSRWGGGSGGWSRGQGRPSYESGDYHPHEQAEHQHRADAEQHEWEESLRQARAEVDDLDSPFPRPEGGFEPPKPSSPSD